MSLKGEITLSTKVFGIDLGTNNIKIYREKKGVIVTQKNILAMNHENEIIAYGDDAFEMYEKAPENITVTFPMKNGVIADFSDMQDLLHLFVTNSSKRPVGGNKEFYIAVPSNITEVEKRAFLDLIESSRLRSKHVHIVEKPLADAVGIGLDVKGPTGIMLVDIGGQTTEISVMSLGGIVISKLVQIGGNKFDEDIMLAVKKEKNVVIGLKTAEECKNQLADAKPGSTGSIKVMGRDLLTGLPAQVEVDAQTVYDAIKEDIYAIMDAIKIILERTPPEISSDIIDSGIYVTGGCSKIQNLNQVILEETDLPGNFFEHPENTVIQGLGKIIEEDDLKDLAFAMSQPSYE